MTKNKAAKTAARERAARTGEPYVVARRVVAAQPARVDGLLHRLTHLVPGVPEHGASRPHAPHVHRARQHGEPRVLVGLQNWIARRASR